MMLNVSSSVTTVNLTTMTTLSGNGDLRELYQTVIAVTFLLITMTIAFFGNIIVIAVIFMYRSLRQDISNMLLVNLSITDLANTIFVMMSALVSLILDEWPFGQFWCDCVCGINYCLIIVSMLTLCEISIDRYQAVMHPLSYISRVTRPRLLVAIIYTWIQGMAFGLVPPVLNWVAYDYWEGVCAIQWHLNRPPSLIYVIIAFMVCFLGPGIVLIYCYVKILKEVKKQKAMNCSTAPSHDSKMKKRRASETHRIMMSLIVVVFAYFICTTPFSLTKLIKVSVTNQKIMPGSVNLTASLLGYVASAINPLVYGIFRRDFRQAYIKFIKVTLLNHKYRGSLSQTNIRRNVSVTVSGANNVTVHNTDTTNTGLRSAQNSPQLKSVQASLRRKAVRNSSKLATDDPVTNTKANTNDSNQNITMITNKQICSIPGDTNTENDNLNSNLNHTNNLVDINVIQLKSENGMLNGHIHTENKTCSDILAQKLDSIFISEKIAVDSNHITETRIIPIITIETVEGINISETCDNPPNDPVIEIVDANHNTEPCDAHIPPTEESTFIQQDLHKTNSAADIESTALTEKDKLHEEMEPILMYNIHKETESILKNTIHKDMVPVSKDIINEDTVTESVLKAKIPKDTESILKDIIHKDMEPVLKETIYKTVITVGADTVITDIASNMEDNQDRTTNSDTPSQHQNHEGNHDNVWNCAMETKKEDQADDSCLGSVVSCRHILVQPVNHNSPV